MIYANIIAAIEAIVAAIAVWQTERNYRNTQETYRKTFSETLAAPDTQARAETLQQVLPPFIAETFYENINSCWTRFQVCIEGKSSDDELVACEVTNQQCICSNLRSLVRNNGTLPNDLYVLWMQFACGPKPPASLSRSFTAPIEVTSEPRKMKVQQSRYQKLGS